MMNCYLIYSRISIYMLVVNLGDIYILFIQMYFKENETKPSSMTENMTFYYDRLNKDVNDAEE